MRVHARLQGALHVLIEGVCGQRDNRYLFRVGTVQGADRARRAEAVQHRHTHVHQHGVVVANLALGEHLHRDFAVLRVVRAYFPHPEHFHHDLGVDRHVLRQENVPPCQLRFFHRRLLLFPDRALKFRQHVGGEQRLGHKAVHARVQGLFHDIVPAVCRQDDDGGFAAVHFPDVPRDGDAVLLRHFEVNEDQIV